MAKSSLRAAFLASLTLWLGAASVQANPQVAAILKYPPRQPGVQVSIPSADEQARCKVEVVTGAAKGSSGYVLTDPTGKKLRVFFDHTGDKKIDVFSYFKDGVEVYREIDSNGNERPDQYRWLGSAGMKWGIDANEDGKIDGWRMISAEEAGQEAFLALATNDFERLKALFLSEAEMKALKLPPAQVEKLVNLQRQAKAKFQATLAKLPHLAGAHFDHVETAVPSCDAGEGGDQDLIRFSSRMILYGHEAGKDKKRDWLETGEMIQVGYAWRLTDVPAPHVSAADPVIARGAPELQKLYDELFLHDKAMPAPLLNPEKNDKVADFNLKRVAILQKIAALETPGPQRESWVKQICDNLSAAYQAHHDAALDQLAAVRADLAGKEPAGTLTAYAHYREMWAPYARKLATITDGKELARLQEEWLDRLGKFVQTFPKADDTPDCLWQLAMGAESLGKDEEARRWYQQIHASFPGNPMADKARGAERRLGLVGRDMELKGALLDAPGEFNVAETKGKVVVVYYWSSSVSVAPRDFAMLKALHTAHGAKGLEIVTVNLDQDRTDAGAFLKTNPLPARHLHQDSKEGLAGPLATYYGINSLPTVFLIGRDGRVQNRTLQVSDLEVALKKAL